VTDATIWWIAAGVLVTLELITSTFYLLLIATAAAVSALAAHAGVPAAGQMLIGSTLSVIAVVGCYFWRKKHPRQRQDVANRIMNLDVGATVIVDKWNADGTTTVQYRGSTWTAELVPGVPPNTTGPHCVVEVVGIRLVIEPAPSFQTTP